MKAHCVVCEKEFDSKRNAKTCSKECKRKRGVERMKTRRTPAINAGRLGKLCIDCGSTFDCLRRRGPPSKRCAACRHSHRSEVARQGQEKWRNTTRIASPPPWIEEAKRSDKLKKRAIRLMPCTLYVALKISEKFQEDHHGFESQ